MIRPLDFETVLYLCLHMQESERREREALFDYNPYTHAVDLLREGLEPGYSVWRNGLPVVMGGLRLQRPGVVSTWMAGTEQWGTVVHETTRCARRLFVEALASGVHRIETLSAAFHTQAHRWFRALDLQQEAVLRKYGRSEEDFFLFSRLR